MVQYINDMFDYDPESTLPRPQGVYQPFMHGIWIFPVWEASYLLLDCYNKTNAPKLRSSVTTDRKSALRTCGPSVPKVAPGSNWKAALHSAFQSMAKCGQNLRGDGVIPS